MDPGQLFEVAVVVIVEGDRKRALVAQPDVDPRLVVESGGELRPLPGGGEPELSSRRLDERGLRYRCEHPRRGP